MNTSLTIGPSASLALTCSNERHETDTTSYLHRPGDIIPATIELHKYRKFEALSLHGSIIGETRVWSHPSDREDLYQTMVHTHLNQVTGFSHMLLMINNARAGAVLHLPLTFILPELSTEIKGTNIYERTPPSCELGFLYVDPWGRTYMQPLVEYSLQITLRFRLDGETEIRTISTKHAIKVTTATHSDPPMYTENRVEVRAFTAAVDVRRLRFTRPLARLSIAMAEPPPVAGNGVGGRCRTTGQLQLTWEMLSGACDESELETQLIKIDYQLQARTSFGTRAVDLDGDEIQLRPHKRVESTHLGTFEFRPFNRDDIRNTGVGDREYHTSNIAIPIQVDDSTTPTFSHGLASRDYVMLVKVQVQGLQHAGLTIRVPVQICESTAEQNRKGSQVKSSAYGDMLSAEVCVPDEGLTGFGISRFRVLTCLGTAKVRRPSIWPDPVSSQKASIERRLTAEDVGPASGLMEDTPY